MVRKMFSMRFGEPAPERRSVDQLRGIEGARVKRLYELLATQHRVKWNARCYEVGDFHAADLPNRCLSQAYRVPVWLGGGRRPIGFLHTGKPLSFVYDVADVFKFETVVPVAFKVAGEAERRSRPAASDPVGTVRRGCRDAFRRTGLLDKIIPAIEEMLASGGLPVPEAPEDAQPVAIPETHSGDPGHRG